MLCSMMFFKNVKQFFWGDAVLCVVYLRNRNPPHALENTNPHEMWYGHIPSMSNLIIFGSTCYALILKE